MIHFCMKRMKITRTKIKLLLNIYKSFFIQRLFALTSVNILFSVWPLFKAKWSAVEFYKLTNKSSIWTAHLKWNAYFNKLNVIIAPLEDDETILFSLFQSNFIILRKRYSVQRIRFAPKRKMKRLFLRFAIRRMNKI